MNAAEINRDSLAGGPGLHGVTAPVSTAQLEFLQPVVVRDLVAVGVAFALLDDLLQGRQRRGEILDRGQSPATVVERARGDLASRVTAEDFPSPMSTHRSRIPVAIAL
jgi:hypothetical protein